jgi:hypothetical protein
VTDQQEQMRALVDQVAALGAKVDALQRPTLGPVPQQTAPQQTAAPRPPQIAHAPAKPKKPIAPRAPRPLGPISTGGAPLNAARDDGRR